MGQFDPQLDKALQKLQAAGYSLEDAQMKGLDFVLQSLTTPIFMALCLVGVETTKQLFEVLVTQLDDFPLLGEALAKHEMIVRQWEIAELNNMVKE